ncbi:MAG: hypothetical protein HY800_09425 [Ignavibacteriales bacterium]|nr:hypothetical protein [Ignavibacteriales bacterium]
MSENEQLKSYIDKVLGYIRGDIDHLKKQKVTVSFPYLFLTFAGIDFLGGLQHGFSGQNSRFRSSWFIATWMSKVNSQYAANYQDEAKSLGSYLYAFARSGLFHMACVQRSVNVDADEMNRNFHLCYSSQNGTTVFFHAIQFAEDFIGACDLFLADLFSDQAKVHTAMNNLEQDQTSSISREDSFSIVSLFLPLPSERMSSPPTFPTGSVIPTSSGTQAPPFGRSR